MCYIPENEDDGYFQGRTEEGFQGFLETPFENQNFFKKFKIYLTNLQLSSSYKICVRSY